MSHSYCSHDMLVNTA